MSSKTTGANASPSPRVKTIHRVEYRIVVPTDWVTNAKSQDWVGGVNVPGPADPSFDTFAAPDLDPWIVIGNRPTGRGVSLNQWIKKMTAAHAITFSKAYCENTVVDNLPTSLGGEEARLRGFNCPASGPKAVAAQVLAKHEDRGWFAMCVSEAQFGSTLSAFERHCERWLDTFQFVS